MTKEVDTILKEYKPKIFKTCLGYTNNIDDAQDLTQETLIRIWKGIGGFNRKASLTTWIYRITVNTCLMFIRKNKRTPNFKEIDHTAIITVENKASYREEIEHLYVLISKLDEKDRLIIILYLEELSYSEIADIIGISTNYVGVKINRIKKVLSNKMNVL